MQSALANEITKRSGGGGSHNRDGIWASAFHPCMRQMTLTMVRGETQAPADVERMASWEYGKDRERSLTALMDTAGKLSPGMRFEITDQQKYIQIRGKGNKLLIRGKLDLKVRFQDEHRTKLVVDIKSWHPNVIGRMQTWDDLQSTWWSRSAAYQVACYAKAEKADLAGILLDIRGVPRLLITDRAGFLPLVDEFKANAAGALAAAEEFPAKGDEVLPPWTDDLSLCQHCWCNQVCCNPPTGHRDGTQIVTDEEAILKAEEIVELQQELGDKPKRLEKLLKEFKESYRERLKAVPLMIFGRVVIRAKWKSYTSVQAPAELKKRVAALLEPYKVKDPQGSMSLEVMKIEPEKKDTSGKEAG